MLRLSKLSRHSLYIASYCLAAVLPVYIHAQTSTLDQRPNHSSSSFAGAANRWQLEARDTRKQNDTLGKVEREQRNAYWANEFAEQARFLPSAGGGQGVFQGFYPSDAKEFPVIPNAIWVTAEFISFHVFAVDAAHKALYTEMNFRIDSVFRQPHTLTLGKGNIIDIGIPGGRIKDENGRIVNFRLTAQNSFVQPGHTYLLQLLKQPSGFYQAEREWDLTSGVVTATSQHERTLALLGKSQIEGKNAKDVLQQFNSLLPPEEEH